MKKLFEKFKVDIDEERVKAVSIDDLVRILKDWNYSMDMLDEAIVEIYGADIRAQLLKMKIELAMKQRTMPRLAVVIPYENFEVKYAKINDEVIEFDETGGEDVQI